MREKFDPKVFELGYVALETADIERTKNHYLETIGMTQTAKGDDGSVFLSIGYNHHNIVLRPAKQKALLHLGFHLKPHIAISDFARQVREFGLAATIKSDSQPASPNWWRLRLREATSSSSTARSKPRRRDSRRPEWRRCGLDMWPSSRQRATSC